MLFPSKREKNVLYIEISGFIPKLKGIQDIISKRPSFLDIVDSIIKKGRKSYGIFADISSSNLTLSDAWEIKKAIEIVKRYGVKTVAYLRDGGIPEVFLSESFDRVYTPENAYFFLVGFSATLNTFGEFFRKIKIKIESVKSGKLKSIPELLTKSEVPDDIKKDVKRTISEIYETLSEETRKFSAQIFLKGILSSKELMLNGVVDAITKEPATEIIKKEFGSKEVEHIRKPIQIVSLKRGKTAAIINMSGIISENPSPNFISLSRYSDVINRVNEDKNVETVIIRINSRGGDATVSEIIEEKIKSIKKTKILSVSSIAASGGYLISLGSPKIFSTPFSLIGSIGVFLIKPYIGELTSTIGINTEIISKGDYSTMLSPYKELSQKEKTALENLVKEEHEKFIKLVAESRRIPEENVRKIADGSVFVGKKSKELKLVDDIKSISEIIHEITDSYHIEEYPKISVFDFMRIGTLENILNSQDIQFLSKIAREKISLLSYLPIDFV